MKEIGGQNIRTAPYGQATHSETGENKSRLRTRETGENRLPLFFHDTLTVKGM